MGSGLCPRGAATRRPGYPNPTYNPNRNPTPNPNPNPTPTPTLNPTPTPTLNPTPNPTPNPNPLTLTQTAGYRLHDGTDFNRDKNGDYKKRGKWRQVPLPLTLPLPHPYR